MRIATKKLFTVLPAMILMLSFCLHMNGQQAGKLKLEHFIDVVSVSSPVISPDGREIIYTRAWVDMVNDARPSDLYIMNADGSRNRFLTRGGSPVWSPDGSRVAYVASGEPRGSQIFVKYIGLEGATQITRLEKSPSNVTWSPDGKQIAFSMLVPYQESVPIKMPARPEGAKWTEAPTIITSLVYRRDRVGFIEDGYTHIFICCRSSFAGNLFWNQSCRCSRIFLNK